MPSEFNLPTPLAGNPNMQAMVQVVREEIERIDLTRLLVFLFDTVDEDLLDLLAAQFDMLGYNGWILADSVQAKRELLKGAFELHVLKGTPGGIKEVVGRLGFLGIKLEEGWENFTDGSPEPAINSWAYFRAVYDIPETKPIDTNLLTNLTGLINTYKNARSVLLNFGLNLPQVEHTGVEGTLTLKTYTNGVLTATDVHVNKIIQSGFDWLMSGFFNPYSYDTGDLYKFYSVDRVSFSDNGAPTSEGEVGNLENGLVKLVDSVTGGVESIAGGRLARYTEVSFSLGESEGNGSVIREMGLLINQIRFQSFEPEVTEYSIYKENATNRIFNRIARAPITKTSDIRLEGTWKVLFFNQDL